MQKQAYELGVMWALSYAGLVKEAGVTPARVLATLGGTGLGTIEAGEGDRVPGAALGGLGGLAATLRFPQPERFVEKELPDMGEADSMIRFQRKIEKYLNQKLPGDPGISRGAESEVKDLVQEALKKRREFREAKLFNETGLTAYRKALTRNRIRNRALQLGGLGLALSPLLLRMRDK